MIHAQRMGLAAALVVAAVLFLGGAAAQEVGLRRVVPAAPEQLPRVQWDINRLREQREGGGGVGLPPHTPAFLQEQQRVPQRFSRQPWLGMRPQANVEHPVLLQVEAVMETAGAAPATAPSAASASAPAAAGNTDQLQSTLPYYAPGAVAHTVTRDERTYTPEHQLDALMDAERRTEQAAQLARFNQRLDTQVLAKRAQQLTAHLAAVERRTSKSPSGRVTPLTGAEAAESEESAFDNGANGSGAWLDRMRLQSVHTAEAAENAIRATARAAQRESAKHASVHRHRHGHSQKQHHKHALNLGQRIFAHNRARGRTAGRVQGRTGHSVRLGEGVGAGGDDDVEDEKYMATDKAKEQEVEYEPDESTNNWWWDYWAPYIA